MENLKAFFMRRPERLLGRCGMLFLMAFFVMNLSSCNDDFIEDNGGEIIPPVYHIGVQYYNIYASILYRYP